MVRISHYNGDRAYIEGESSSRDVIKVDGRMYILGEGGGSKRVNEKDSSEGRVILRYDSVYLITKDNEKDGTGVARVITDRKTLSKIEEALEEMHEKMDKKFREEQELRDDLIE